MKCKSCNGYGNYKTQHPGGEVRYPVCSRCDGSGIEPKGLWNKLKASLRSTNIEQGHNRV